MKFTYKSQVGHLRVELFKTFFSSNGLNYITVHQSSIYLAVINKSVNYILTPFFMSAYQFSLLICCHTFVIVLVGIGCLNIKRVHPW